MAATVYPWVSTKRMKPPCDTFCWVKLDGVNEPIPAKFDDLGWHFQNDIYNKHYVTHWKWTDYCFGLNCERGRSWIN